MRQGVLTGDGSHTEGGADLPNTLWGGAPSSASVFPGMSPTFSICPVFCLCWTQYPPHGVGVGPEWRPEALGAEPGTLWAPGTHRLCPSPREPAPVPALVRGLSLAALDMAAAVGQLLARWAEPWATGRAVPRQPHVEERG